MDNTDGFIISSPKTPCAQELFPCPFCDTIPELVDRPHGSYIRCPGCGAMIARDLCSETPDTKQAVIDAWNSRVHYNNIEPCPFCGWDEPAIYSEDELFYVNCGYCGTHTLPCKTQWKAVLDWNNQKVISHYD